MDIFTGLLIIAAVIYIAAFMLERLLPKKKKTFIILQMIVIVLFIGFFFWVSMFQMFKQNFIKCIVALIILFIFAKLAKNISAKIDTLD